MLVVNTSALHKLRRFHVPRYVSLLVSGLANYFCLMLPYPTPRLKPVLCLGQRSEQEASCVPNKIKVSKTEQNKQPARADVCLYRSLDA